MKKENIEENTTQDNNVDNCKHIVLCVDQTPSMKPIMEAVNKGVEAFVQVFARANINANLASITFDDVCDMKQEERIGSFKSEYSVKDKFSINEENKPPCVAEVLKKAYEHLTSFKNGFVVVVTDGVLEPYEEKCELEKQINKIEEKYKKNYDKGCKIQPSVVGFAAERDNTELRSLLHYFSNLRIRTFVDSNEFEEAFKKIANDIINAPIIIGSKGKHS